MLETNALVAVKMFLLSLFIFPRRLTSDAEGGGGR